jgi:hypothetical protein
VIVQLSINQRARYVCEQLEAWKLDWSLAPGLQRQHLLSPGEVRPGSLLWCCSRLETAPTIKVLAMHCH